MGSKFIDFQKATFPIIDFQNATFTIIDFQKATFPIIHFQKATFPIIDFQKATFTIIDFQKATFTICISQLYNRPWENTHLKNKLILFMKLFNFGSAIGWETQLIFINKKVLSLAQKNRLQKL